MPATTSLLLTAAANLGAGLLGSRMKTRVPDYSGRAINQGLNHMRMVDEDESRSLDRLEGDLAAAGATGFQGTAARESLARSAGSNRASARAGILDTIARAEMAEEQARADIHNRNVDARRGALTNTAAAASLIAMGLTPSDQEDNTTGDVPTTTGDLVAGGRLSPPRLHNYEGPVPGFQMPLAGPRLDGLTTGGPSALPEVMVSGGRSGLRRMQPMLPDINRQLYAELNPQLRLGG